MPGQWRCSGALRSGPPIRLDLTRSSNTFSGSSECNLHNATCSSALSLLLLRHLHPLLQICSLGSELFSDISLPGDPSLPQIVQIYLHLLLINLCQHLLADLAGYSNFLLVRFSSCSVLIVDVEISSSKPARALSFSPIFISAFSSTFFVISMSHLPLLRLCLSVNTASRPPLIILQTLPPRMVVLAVLVKN